MGTDQTSKQDTLLPELSLSALEADIAYFDARLAMLSDNPTSYYQEAQLRAYKELETVLGEQLKRLRHAKHSGFKVD